MYNKSGFVGGVNRMTAPPGLFSTALITTGSGGVPSDP